MVFTHSSSTLRPLGLCATLLLGFITPPHSFGADAAVAAPTYACPAKNALCEQKTDLTLASALRFALDNNAELAAAAKEIDALDASALQAGLFSNPVVGVEAEDIRRPERSTTIRISQLIELGGKRAARMAVSSMTRDAAAQDYDIKRRNLALSVAQNFIELLSAQEHLRFSQEAVQLAQRVSEAASKRVEAGKASPLEKTRAQLALTSARIDLDQAMRDNSAARRRLSTLWGNVVPQFTQAVGDLEAMVALPAFEALKDRAKTNPILLRTTKEVAQRESILKLEMAKRTPDVSVTAGIRKYALGGEEGLVVGVSIPLPLFDRNQGNIIAAQQRVGQAQDLKQATETKVISDLAQTYEALVAAETEIRTLRRDVLPAARSAYDAANKGFEYGKFDSLDVLDAQRTLFQNQRLYLRSLGNYQRLVTEIEQFIAGPVGGIQPVTPSHLAH